MKRFFCIAAALLMISVNTYSLELSSGRIKLELHENTGRFSVYYLVDVADEKYIPLLFSKDPQTTSLYVSMGNKVFTMGDSSFFDQSIVENSGESASFVWKSKQLEVTQNFTLIKSVKSAFIDGLKITVTVKNISQDSKRIGIGYLLDTYLGESSKIHFKTDGGMVIDKETYYSSDFPEYVISPYEKGKDKFKGLQIMLKGPGITIPDKIIFANWKRLKENIWNYTIQNSRNFNLLPYSINDSAAALYYNPYILKSGEKRTVTMVIGAFTGSFFQGKDADEDTSEINKLYLLTASGPENYSDTEATVKTDLIAVEDLISKIDEKLKYPNQVTEDELNLLKQIIDNLEKRKKLYENR